MQPGFRACLLFRSLRAWLTVLRTGLCLPRHRGMASLTLITMAPCRAALSVFPLTPSPEREGILVSLDTRQANQEVGHVYLASRVADPRFFIRYLALQAPPCYRIAIQPRPNRAGMLELAHGDVIVFGYKEDHPWSTDEESSSEGGESEDDELRPSDDDVPDSHNGHSDQGSTDGHEDPDNHDRRSRSRSPRGPPPPVPVRGTMTGHRTHQRDQEPPGFNLGSGMASTGLTVSGSLFKSLAILCVCPVTSIHESPRGHSSRLESVTCAMHDAAGGAVWLGLCIWVLYRAACILHALCLRQLRHVLGPKHGSGVNVRHRWLSSQPRSCRLLQEPQGRTPAHTRHVGHLRRVTRWFGDRWLRDPLGLGETG